MAEGNVSLQIAIKGIQDEARREAFEEAKAIADQFDWSLEACKIAAAIRALEKEEE